MKNRLLIFSALFISSLLFACGGGSISFSAGTKKDISTGLATSWKGLHVEDAYLMDLKTKERINSNEVTQGDEIAIVVTGVDNLTESEGKVAPGLDISVTDPSGKEVLGAKDILSNEFAKDDVNLLQATLTVGNPLQSGNTYHMKARFYDKKGEGEITSEIDLKVK
ncbi:MAG: hypothetical protein HC880_19795 [Bacteroidia bacterium]|nr:hypothetical protein [Bacteroidia bacterium]